MVGTVSDQIKTFEDAVAAVPTLTKDPGNDAKLALYGLYKQATEGDVEGKKPGFGDMVGRAKWDAWNGFKGTDKEGAMQQYIDLIESLKSK